jgi:hypothetical protein
MWLFIKDAFVSIVEANGEPDMVLVRARCKKHLETFLPAHKKAITDDQDRDYRFRVKAPKAVVAERISKYVLEELTYGNFKGAQDYKDRDWTRALHDVWGVMYGLQSRETH